MRVFVTGTAGIIGVPVARPPLAHGHPAPGVGGLTGRADLLDPDTGYRPASPAESGVAAHPPGYESSYGRT